MKPVAPTYASIYLEYAASIQDLAESGKLSAAVRRMESAGRMADLFMPLPQPYNDHDVDMLVASAGSPS